MGTMVALFTGCAVALIGCAYLMVLCMRASERATHAADRLRATQGTVAGLAGALEQLEARWRKLNGRVSYLTTAIEMQADDEYVNDEPADDKQPAPITDTACENYARAQVDGPLSKAARCACPYCEGMRSQRALTRAALLPKGAVAQAKFARENVGK